MEGYHINMFQSPLILQYRAYWKTTKRTRKRHGYNYQWRKNSEHVTLACRQPKTLVLAVLVTPKSYVMIFMMCAILQLKGVNRYQTNNKEKGQIGRHMRDVDCYGVFLQSKWCYAPPLPSTLDKSPGNATSLFKLQDYFRKK